MPLDPSLVEVNTLLLEKVKIGMTASLVGVKWNDLKVQTVHPAVDALCDQLRVGITGWVVGSRRHTTATKRIHRPLTWWDAFKDRWFSSWLLRRFPVEWESICVETLEQYICPHLDIPALESDQRVHLSFLRHTPKL